MDDNDETTLSMKIKILEMLLSKVGRRHTIMVVRDESHLEWQNVDEYCGNTL